MKIFKLVHAKAKENCIKFIENIKLDAKLEVVIKKTQSSRSLAQNNLLHMWLGAIRDERHLAGYDLHSIDVWKEFFRQRFLVPESVIVNGQVVTIRKSTTKLTIKEFAVLLQKIEAYSTTELSIFLPSPDDLMYRDL